MNDGLATKMDPFRLYRRVWYAVCFTCGTRPFEMETLPVTYVCDGCGRVLDHFETGLQVMVQAALTEAA